MNNPPVVRMVRHRLGAHYEARLALAATHNLENLPELRAPCTLRPCGS
jgi:hypothetical protein